MAKKVKQTTFNPVYRMGRAVSSFLFKGMFAGESFGVENVPKQGPFLLACNHVSYFDPFIAGCFFHRPIYFFARKTLFKKGIVAWTLNKFNAIPVDVKAANDITAFRRVLELLKSGEGLLVFPEGTRSKDGKLKEPKAGVGMMACRTQVPVVPVRLFGSYEALGRGAMMPDFTKKITVVYGKPIYPKEYDPGKKDPQRYQKAVDKIMEAMAALEIPKGDLI